MAHIDKRYEPGRLAQLMDFGRFAGDSRLAALAAGAETRYPAGTKLSDDDLEDLFAAGDPSLLTRREDGEHDR